MEPDVKGAGICTTTRMGWGPRLGLAYQIAEKTVVRAGAGIFYGTNKAPGLNGANNGFTNSPSWSSQNNGITPAFNWNSGFPAWEAPPFINPGFNAGFSVPWYGAEETGPTAFHSHLELCDLPRAARELRPGRDLHREQGNASGF